MMASKRSGPICCRTDSVTSSPSDVRMRKPPRMPKAPAHPLRSNGSGRSGFCDGPTRIVRTVSSSCLKMTLRGCRAAKPDNSSMTCAMSRRCRGSRMLTWSTDGLAGRLGCERRPAATRSAGWTHASVTVRPSASAMASRSGMAHRCSDRSPEAPAGSRVELHRCHSTTDAAPGKERSRRSTATSPTTSSGASS
jgi:hypothetical protein